MQYTITTQAGFRCPYCKKAVELLDDKGLAYSIRALSGDALYEVAKKANMTTVPIIHQGEELIGGFTELQTRLN